MNSMNLNVEFPTLMRFYPLQVYILDAVGSWQIILPMPKSERVY